MYIDRTIGLADWPQTEVVGPADHHPIELFHDCLRIPPDCVSPGLVADSSTDALHPFRGWYRAQIDSAPSSSRTCIPESQTSLPADNRPASCSRSPSA